jgi:serine protease Do
MIDSKPVSLSSLAFTVAWLAFLPAESRARAAESTPVVLPDDVRRDATVAAVEKVMPSVVNIGTKTHREKRGYLYDWFRNNWTPYRQVLPPQESAGSGVIIDEDGFVLTNVHVIEDATEIWVTVDGKLYQADWILGEGRSDVALLKIRSEPGTKFTPARFAADDDLLLGETVIALGNPYGLGGSVSKGILSAKNRRESFTGGQLNVPDWLQTDASINPGNSGGPLINLRGEVLGINVAIFRDGQGIGFAIPIKVISEVLSEMYTPEKLRGLWFGARVKAGQYPLVITGVEPESPAAKAGLREGDLVLRVNRVSPRSFIEFSRQLLAVGEKDDVEVIIRRNLEEKAYQVRMVAENTYFNSELVRKRLGTEVQQLTRDLAQAMKLNFFGGLIVSDVERNSPAAKAGIRKGMVIRAIDGVTPPDVPTAARYLRSRESGEKIRLDLVVQVQLGSLLQTRTATAEVALR